MLVLGANSAAQDASYWAQGLGDHVPRPTNDSKVLLTIRFRLVSTMVWGVVRFLEFFGKNGGLPAFGVGCEKRISNAASGRKAWRLMRPSELIVRACQ